MRLDVLGCSGTFPSPGGACSGYVLRQDGFTLWMDAGTGTMANLPADQSLAGIGALFLSHMHPDHFVDLYPLFYGISLLPSGPHRIPVIAPPGSLAYAERLLSDDAKPAFRSVFDWREIAPGEHTELGPFRLRTFDAVHSAPNLTLRIESDGKVLCYSGDTGPNDELAPAARDADLFVCEASWQRDTEVSFGAIHMRAHEAGRAAKQAGVNRLMLTHIWPTLDAARSVEEASAEFEGQIDLAVTREGTDV